MSERWKIRCADGEKNGGVWYFAANGGLISFGGRGLHRSEGFKPVKNGASGLSILFQLNTLHRSNGEIR